MTLLNIDMREVNRDNDWKVEQVTALAKQHAIPVKVSVLATGDYVVGDRLAIEAKSPDDFVGSVFDKRIFAQADEMREHYSVPTIIVYGDRCDVVNHARATPAAMSAAIASLHVKHNVPVVFCGHRDDFAPTVLSYVLKALDDGVTSPYTPLRRQAPTSDRQVYFIASLPGVGQERAKRILGVYVNPAVAVANVDNWADDVRGVGDDTVRKVKDVLETTWSPPQRT